MVNLRKATIEDGAFILEVRNHESTLKQLHDPRKFDLNSFETWFNNSSPEWFIILLNDKNIGYVRTKWLEPKKILQVGADLHPDYRGKGYAKPAYEQLFENFCYVEKFSLEVFIDNTVALNLYQKLGFKKIKECQYLIDGNFRTSITMEKFYE